MYITDDIIYVGCNDHDIDLFEGQYDVRENGMAYNSYVVLDERPAVMDTIDRNFTDEWLANVEAALAGREPAYLVVHHMEPDHSASIAAFLERYPQATVVSSKNAFKMMENYFGRDFAPSREVVGEGSTLSLGRHELTFIGARMVHWPEVHFSYDSADKVLFSADAFGKFGALDVDEEWACEARRYYFGIVGTFGKQVQDALAKVAGYDVHIICPLHGPVLSENLDYYLDLYNTWSSYGVESPGIAICYTSVYGHMKEAVELLAALLEEKGCPKVAISDLARDDVAEAMEDCFRYGTVVFATTTYNNGVFPAMRHFLDDLVEHNFQKRMVGLMEGGTWAPKAAKHMRAKLEECADIEFCSMVPTVKGGIGESTRAQIEVLACQLLGIAVDLAKVVDSVSGATPKPKPPEVDAYVGASPKAHHAAASLPVPGEPVASKPPVPPRKPVMDGRSIPELPNIDFTTGAPI